MANLPTAEAAREYPPLRGGKLLFLTSAIATAAFMEILDMTIVNVSVPNISGSLGVSNSEGTWVVSSYMLTAAVVQPLTGWIARRFGEVRTFVTSVCLFMLFSAICGLATTLPMLVAARLIQGFVSGPMMSVAQAILLRNYPSERRGMAIALFSMVIIIAPIVGPILGGWITDNLSWPWLFYINLLVGVGSLQFMLDNGNERDWFSSPLIAAMGIVSLISLTFLIVVGRSIPRSRVCFGSEQFHSHHVGQHLDGGDGLDLESPHRLPSLDPRRTHQQLRKRLEPVSGATRRAWDRRRRCIAIRGTTHRQPSLDARRQ